MSYRIEVGPEARQEIRALPVHVRAQARQLIAGLADHPRPSFARELREKPNIFRIWLAGRWRLVYQIEEKLERIRILRIRRKEDIEYETLDPRTSELHQPLSRYLVETDEGVDALPKNPLS